jgi:hypothetical protein
MLSSKKNVQQAAAYQDKEPAFKVLKYCDLRAAGTYEEEELIRKEQPKPSKQ